MPSSTNGNNKRPGEDILDASGVQIHEAAGRLFDNVGQVGGGSARKKTASSSRTGQACDRCKIRKIRCDARPGGCSPCAQNNTECKTTDRITGRATSRGHTEHIEGENNALKMYMLDLQQQLRDNGIEPKTPPNMSQTFAAFQPYWDRNGQQQGSWGDLSTAGVVPGSSHSDSNGPQTDLPEFRPGCIGDNYVGVSSSNPLLSPIEGMQLSLFGVKLDLADFLPAEEDPLSDPLSYQTFLKFAFNRSGHIYEPPPLPSYGDCTTLAEWYFKMVQVFIPIVHKPDFMKLLSRIHYGQQQTSTAETVIVHMVVTLMTFQGALRNGDEQARLDALTRYHYCLGLIPDLVSGHQLQDMQALALICSFMRSQPRLGAAWMFTNGVLGMAIEQGLHRSAKSWKGENAESDPHTIEMRKRVFWSLLVIHVNLSGKFGRPMPLRPEDFDIEIPEQLPDNLPGESELNKWENCSFRAAIPGMRLLKILMQVYAAVYSIKSGNEPYEVSMRTLEKELMSWRSQLPPEWVDDKQMSGEDRVASYYLRTTEQGIRLLLHHPSLCRSMSPQVTSSNLDECLDASAKLLDVSTKLKDMNSLDTTWYFATDYLAAIFTTIFAYNERRDELTSQSLQQLRTDMERWLAVMGDVGKLLGSGTRLQDTLRTYYVEPSLAQISEYLATKTASAGLASVDSSDTSPVEQTQQSRLGENTNGYTNSFNNGTDSVDGASDSRQSYGMNGRASTHAQNQSHYPSNPNNHYYTEAQSSQQMANYMPSYDTSYTEDIKPNLDAQMNAHNVLPQHQHHRTPTQQSHHTPIQAPSNFMAAFQQSPPQQNGFHPPSSHGQGMALHHAGQAAWRHFADGMTMLIPDQQGYMNSAMNSANTLMAMGNKGHGHGGMDMTAGANVAGLGGLHLQPDQMQQQPWPLIYNTSGDAQ